jgi:membrane protease YdiL (CAAX protease family)
VAILRRHRIGLGDLGLPDPRRATRTIAVLAAVGLFLVLTRALAGPISIFGGTPFFGNGSPAGGPQRLVWVVVAITAGLCEEFVYRGVALTLLRRRGLSPVASVALASVPFALMHGPAGIFGFPFVGTLAVLMSIVYLRTRSLAPGIVMHALLDLSVILT